MTANVDNMHASPRMRRLWADHSTMLRLAALSSLIDVAAEGEPPDRYIVTYHCAGLARRPGQKRPALRKHHICEVYLHRDYPGRPPVLSFCTPIFHPNIMPPEKGGTVCIGAWTPGESLTDLIIRVGEMIQYNNYDLDDALNTEAIPWVRRNQHLLPVDRRPLAPGF